MRGTGSAVLITGEAGIGKTRFASEAVALARRRHHTALWGRAQPLDRTRSFAPIVEAFGSFLRSCPTSERDDLTAGLPLLAQLLPATTAPTVDVDIKRTRLFESVLRLLGRIASRRPVALVLDDLHWADGGSIELLDYLLRDLAGMPVLVLVTYRPEDLTAARARTFVGTVHRTVDAREITLSRLDDRAVAALLAVVIGCEPSPDLVELVSCRSLGVPLYVEAYGQWLVESGALSVAGGAAGVSPAVQLGIPPAIRDVLGGRLAALPHPERDVVALLAVGGDEASRDVLLEVGGDGVDAALDSLVAHGLVTETDDGCQLTYRLYHPLVSEVAYAAIPTCRRRDLHVRFVGVLREWDEPAALVPHVEGAGAALPPADAARLLLDAGRCALDRFAYEDASRCLARSLELAESACPALIGGVLRSYGEALRRGGETSAAIGAWQRALARTPARDVVQRATLHQRMADAYSDCGQTAAAVHEVETALSLLDDHPPSQLHMELLFVLMASHQRRLDVPAAGKVAGRIERVATVVATPEAELMASLARFAMLLERARYEDALRFSATFADRLVDHPTIQLEGLQFRALEALVMGDLGRLRSVNAEIEAMDRRVGIPGSNYRRYVYAFGEALYRGTWDEAQDIVDEFELAVAGSENSRAATLGPTVGALLAAYRGDDEEAERRLWNGRGCVEQGLVEPAAGHGVLGVLGALVALERADVAAALDWIEPVAGRNPFVLAGVIPPWGLVALAEARARGGDPDAARTSAAQLARVGPDGTYPQVMARRLAGLAARGDGDDTTAQRLLLEARAGFERLRLPFETARATIEAAEIDADGLAGELAAAHRTARALGARRYETRAARLLRAAGAAVPRGGHQRGTELTSRQSEVAELVAKGLSNAEIAERLFVSVRTITAHLDHVYTRLGINSRAALATYITERRNLRRSTDAGRVVAGGR